MEQLKHDSSKISNKEKLSRDEMHKSRSDSCTTLDEEKPTSPEDDVIMSDENWSYVIETEDTYMCEDYYTEGTYTGDTIIYRPSSGFASQELASMQTYAAASATRNRFESVPQHYRGVLDPFEIAEDAAFFAHANTRYQQGIKEALRQNQEKSKERKSGPATKGNRDLTAGSNITSTVAGGGKTNLIDLL